MALLTECSGYCKNIIDLDNCIVLRWGQENIDEYYYCSLYCFLADTNNEKMPIYEKIHKISCFFFNKYGVVV